MGGNSSKPLHEQADNKVTGRPTSTANSLPDSFLQHLKDENLMEYFQFPNTPAYIANNVSWNFDAIGSPSAFFVPPTIPILQQFIRLYQKQGPLPQPHTLSIAGGRHSHWSLHTHALVIDMKLITHIEINKEAKTGKFGAGLKLREFDKHCKAANLATTAGTNPDTGIAGLILGGGFGYLARLRGLAIDNLISVQVLLMNGEIVHATRENEHKDLLWGIRGGGGNFGIVLEFELQLYDQGDVFAGANVYLTRKFTKVDEVLKQWVEFCNQPNLPREITCWGVLICNGPVVLPTAYVGTDLAAGEKLLAPLRAIGKPMISSFNRMPYSNSGTVGKDLQSFAEKEQMPGNYYESGIVLNDLTPAAIEILLKYTVKPLAPNGESQLLIAHLGGAVSEPLPENESPLGFRHGKFIVIILGRWKNHVGKPTEYIKEREKVKTWLKNIVKDMSPFLLSTYNTVGDTELDRVKVEAIGGKVTLVEPATVVAGSSSSGVLSPGSPEDAASIQPATVTNTPNNTPPLPEGADAAASSSSSSSSSSSPVAVVSMKVMNNWSEQSHARLRSVKNKYDPMNILRNNNNVEPLKGE